MHAGGRNIRSRGASGGAGEGWSDFLSDIPLSTSVLTWGRAFIWCMRCHIIQNPLLKTIVKFRPGTFWLHYWTFLFRPLFRPPLFESLRSQWIGFIFEGLEPTAVPNILYACAWPWQYLTACIKFVIVLWWKTLTLTLTNFSFNAGCKVEPVNYAVSHYR